MRLPTYLTAKAKTYWKKVVPELEKLGLVEAIDQAALELLCESYATFRQATDELKTTGLTQVTKSGYTTKHPLVSVRQSALDAYHRLSARFAITPSSRQKLKLEDKPEGEDWKGVC